MKMPFTTTTKSRIDAARRALAAAETTITKLEQDRAATLADSDDLDVLRTIDHRLADEQRTAQACRDRLAALESKLAAESEQARQQAYAADVNKIGESLKPLEKAAAEIELAAKAMALACQRYVAVIDDISSHWPANVPRPGTNHAGYPVSGHYTSRARLGEFVRRTFSPPSLVRSTSHAAPPTSDYVTRALTAIERLDGFADAERRNRADLVDDLNQRGVPIYHVEEEAA
jgi:hypothetical protein